MEFFFFFFKGGCVVGLFLVYMLKNLNYLFEVSGHFLSSLVSPKNSQVLCNIFCFSMLNNSRKIIIELPFSLQIYYCNCSVCLPCHCSQGLFLSWSPHATLHALSVLGRLLSSAVTSPSPQQSKAAWPIEWFFVLYSKTVLHCMLLKQEGMAHGVCFKFP